MRVCIRCLYLSLSFKWDIQYIYTQLVYVYIHKKNKKTQPFTGTLWFAVAVEVVVAALVLMYVEGYGTNEALPGKVLLRCCYGVAKSVC